MTKHERRRRAEEDANQVREAAEARRQQWFSEREKIISLFEALPNSLDSLCGDHFASRATKLYFLDQASPVGWTHLIDGRAVSEAEHRELCQILIDRLMEIVNWCVQWRVGVEDLVVTEIKRTISLRQNPHFRAETALQKSPSWLLGIVVDLAEAKANEAFSDLMQCWVRLPVKQTMSFLLNTLLETQFPIGSVNAQDEVSARDPIKTDASKRTGEKPLTEDPLPESKCDADVAFGISYKDGGTTGIIECHGFSQSVSLTDRQNQAFRILRNRYPVNVARKQMDELIGGSSPNIIGRLREKLKLVKLSVDSGYGLVDLRSQETISAMSHGDIGK